MRYRRYGKTGLELSIFTLGTKSFSIPQDNQGADANSARARQTIERAVALGVNHFNTTPADPEGQTLLGTVLSGLGRDDLHVTTRIPICNSPDEMRVCIEESLKRLQVDTLEILTLDGINTPQCLNKVTSPTGCMKAVEEAQEQGIVKHLGIATDGPLEFILKALDTEMFEAIHLHYSYFNQRNAKVLDKAAEMEVGVLTDSPTNRGGSLHAPNAILEEACEPLPPAVVNHRFILQHPAVTTLNLNARHRNEFDLHEPVFDNDGELSDAENLSLARLDVRRLQIADTWCTHCYDCLPCPEAINIPEILRLRNMALAYEMLPHVKEQYALLGKADSAWMTGKPATGCTECGECLPRCPERLDIPKLLFQLHDLTRPAGRRKVLKTNKSKA